MPELKDVPVIPGSVPVLGHGWALWRNPLSVLCSLSASGDLVRVNLGPRAVYFVTHPDLVHELLVVHGNSVAKGRLFERARDFVGVGITTSDGELHRRQRRLVQPAFHRQRLAGYAEIMNDSVRELTSSWSDGQTIQLDVTTYEMTVSTVARALFSTDATPQLITDVQRLLPQVANGLFTRTLLPRALTRVPTGAGRAFADAVRRLRALVDDVVLHHRSNGTGRDDLLTMLLSARDPDTGRPMDDRQLSDEVMTIMMSGAETTAIVLAWAFHELGRYPEIANQIRAEAEPVVRDGRLPYDKVDTLRYTGQVLSEVMRLHSVPLMMRRTTTAVRLAGVEFPPGSDVAYSPYAMHRDPRFFSRPDHFEPGRWSGAPEDEPLQGAYTPFGAGKRKCVGDRFAWTELVIALSTILVDWELHPVNRQAPEETMSASIPRPSTLPMTLVNRRDRRPPTQN